MSVARGHRRLLRAGVDDAGGAQPSDNRARGTYIDIAGTTQPAPAPRFSRTVPAPPTPASDPGTDTDAILRSLSVSDDEIANARTLGIVG